MRRFVTTFVTTALGIGVVACGGDSGNTVVDSIGLVDVPHATDSIGAVDSFYTDDSDTSEHPVVCCLADSDCRWDPRCVLPDGGGSGQCSPSVEGGYQCYRTDDCLPSYVCEGAVLCDCADGCTGDACEPPACRTTAGWCWPVGSGCCTDPSECAEGTSCVNLSGAPQGTCLPVPTGPHPSSVLSINNYGACWTDSDCTAATLQCYGASQCPCGGDCEPLADMFGLCVQAGFKECVAKHQNCECGGPDCQDGESALIYYPEREGDFPPSAEPSQALLDGLAAMHTCSGCSCEQHWYTSDAAQGVAGAREVASAEEFCLFVVGYSWELQCGEFCGYPQLCQGHDGTAGGCLKTWQSSR